MAIDQERYHNAKKVWEVLHDLDQWAADEGDHGLTARYVRKGTKGTRKDPTADPVYRELTEERKLSVISVGQRQVGVPNPDLNDEAWTGTCLHLPTPTALGAWMRRFDEGEFPELVDEDNPILHP